MAKDEIPWGKIMIAGIAAILFTKISAVLGWKLTLFVYAGALLWFVLV